MRVVSTVDRMYTSLTMMTTSKTTRLQDYTNHKGLALCGHITLDETAGWWVPINTHGTPAPQRREAVGGPKLHKRLQAANKTQTLTCLATLTKQVCQKHCVSQHSKGGRTPHGWEYRKK